VSVSSRRVVVRSVVNTQSAPALEPVHVALQLGRFDHVEFVWGTPDLLARTRRGRSTAFAARYCEVGVTSRQRVVVKAHELESDADDCAFLKSVIDVERRLAHVCSAVLVTLAFAPESRLNHAVFAVVARPLCDFNLVVFAERYARDATRQRAVLADLARAVLSCHGWGVAHGNLSPTNVLLVKGPGERLEVKLTDFCVGLRVGEPWNGFAWGQSAARF